MLYSELATRTRVVSSVHAFDAVKLGNICSFLLLGVAVCLVAYVKNRDYLRARTSSIRWFRANRASCLTI